VIVIKLGGSLAVSGKLQACLEKIGQAYQGRAVVIVPGGGAFADQVRQAQQQWQFDDRAAHQMAILAMQQMALLLKALKPSFGLAFSTDEIINETGHKPVVIWSPTVHELDDAGIPSTWEMTSDSLSAWLAKTLDAEELILVKSVTIDTGFDVPELVQQQVVDASFNEYTQRVPFKTTIINAEKFVS
jgi:5-(aminomethyl)-3-furanmethanol phosphate kinase